MPADTRETLIRMWELLKLLPRGGSGRTATELTASLKGLGFDVSLRQLQRDLPLLQEIFPQIECNDSAKPYGWRWARDAMVELPGLELTDALSLKLTENALRLLLPASLLQALEPKFDQAKRTLRDLAPRSKAATWTRKVRSVPPGLPLIPPKISPEVLEVVQAALLNDHQLEVIYRSAGADAGKAMTLHPCGLILRGSITYLVATAFDYKDPRLYALHRMTAPKELTGKSEKPDNFDLDQYVEDGHLQFGDGKPFVMKAWVNEFLAKLLQETPLAQDQSLKPAEDGYALTATLKNTWQLRWWILSQGPAIVITSPAKLRREIADELSKAADRYAQSPVKRRRGTPTGKKAPMPGNLVGAPHPVEPDQDGRT